MIVPEYRKEAGMANPNPSPRTRWKKGQSGNPGGRRTQPLTTALRAKVTPEVAEQIVDVAISQALAGDAVARAWLADRLEGKAVARTEQGEPGDFGISLQDVRRAIGIVAVPRRDPPA
jgi:hypothetical protein